MLLNFAFCIVGCTALALLHVASFLYGLGCDTRSTTGGVPFWVLLLGAAVLPLLACVCCFYASLSVGGEPASRPRPEPYPERMTIPITEPVRVAKLVAR